MKRLGLVLVTALAAMSAAYAGSATVVKTPEGITISKESPTLSWSRSIGHVPYASASATAYASDPHFASASATSSASVRTNGNGHSIAKSFAEGKADGMVTSTSAVSQP